MTFTTMVGPQNVSAADGSGRALVWSGVTERSRGGKGCAKADFKPENAPPTRRGASTDRVTMPRVRSAVSLSSTDSPTECRVSSAIQVATTRERDKTAPLVVVPFG